MSYKISQRVDNYIKHRPRYPGAILDLLKTECRLTRDHLVADVGTGTGILAEMFLENGNQVIGIEPDPYMRAGAAFSLRDYPNFSSINATAEATTLTGKSIDFVTVGQAFHWFDLEEVKREFSRILAHQGWIVLVWNLQRATGNPFLEALQGFWETKEFWKPPFQRPLQRKAQAGRLNPDLVREWLLDPFFGPVAYKEKQFENPLVCNFERLKGRVLSNGPALEPGDHQYPAMIAALEEIFHTHQENGNVTIEHDTRVVYGRPKSEG